MKSGFLTFLAIIVLAASCPAEDTEQNPQLGQIVSAENTVKIVRAASSETESESESETESEDGDEITSEEIIAQAGDPLFAGDTLVTGEDSKVSFTLNPDSRFDLGESTEVSIDELSDMGESEVQPLLRLVTGFLHSAIKGISGNSRPAVQTPTAVAGIRGTEFDTVVALDGTTALSVKEGSVELDWESGKTLLATGQMAEVDEESEKVEALAAVPGKNWKAWIAEKEKDFPEKLRRKMPRFRQRFEKAEAAYAVHQSRIQEAQLRVAKAMEAVRAAEESGNPQALEQANLHFERETAGLKKNVAEARPLFNKMKTAGRQWAKIGKYAKKNKNRFSEEDLRQIRSQGEYFKVKGKALKADSRKVIRGLKKSAKEIRKFKKEKAKKHKDDKRKDGKDKDRKHKDGKHKDRKHKDGKHKDGKDKDREHKDGKHKDGKDKDRKHKDGKGEKDE